MEPAAPRKPDGPAGLSAAASECLVTVVVANPTRLLIGTAPDDGQYGKHVAEKCRGSGVEEAPYACRPGTRLQFRRVSGEILGAPLEVGRFTVRVGRDAGPTTPALVIPESLRTPSGEPIPLPALPARTALSPAPPAEPAAAAAPPPPAPPAPVFRAVPPAPEPKKPAAPPRTTLDVPPAVEEAMRTQLRRENSDLHLTLRKNGAPAGSVTWIDALQTVAEEKYRGDPTPLGKLVQIYLHPLYLRAPHADLRKASEMVDHVVGFVARLRAQGDAGVRKFAGQLLEGRGGDEQDQGVQLMTGRGLRTLEESLGKLQDPKTPRAALEAVYRELPSVFARSFQLMHRADTDSAKREIHDTLRQTLEQSRGTKFYQSMSRQQREVFDQSHTETLRRLDSAARQNGMQGRK
ncbi:MAG: hypothetical protein ACKO5R_10285 [Planctomycetaceae bacterium]